MIKQDRILIIGSNGFIARNLIHRLRHEGHFIIGISKGVDDKNNLDQYYCRDITDLQSFKDLIGSICVDYIFHVGGLVTAERDFELFDRMMKENFLTTFEIIKRFKKNTQFKRYFFFSSTEEYGDVRLVPITEETTAKPNSPYALAKNITVSLLKVAGENEKFPSMVVRPSIVFGKYMPKDKFIPTIINSLSKDEEIKLTLCQQQRDFIHINQLLDLLFELNKKTVTIYSEFNITSGIRYKLEEVALIIAEELHKSPYLLKFGAIPYRKNEMMNYEFSIEKISLLTGISISRKDILKKIKNYIKYEYDI